MKKLPGYPDPPGRDFAVARGRWQSRAVRLLLLAVLASPALAEEPSPATAAWQAASHMLTDDAYRLFSEQANQPGGAAPAMLLGQAAALLNLQPKTEGNVDKAVRLLDTVIEREAGTDLAIEAEYLRARAEQIHRADPDLRKARELFGRLVEAHPGHPLAEIAAVKLATLEFWDAGGAAGARREALTRWSARVDAMQFKPARKDMHLLIADANLFFSEDKAAALDHSLKAEALGIIRAQTRGNLLVQIGELAGDLGRTDVARMYYNLFLDEYKRDARRQLVVLRLENLSGPAGIAP